MQFWWKRGKLEKHPVVRFIVNLVLFILAILLFMILYSKLKTNLIFAIGITVLMLGFPLLQRHGRMMLEKERVIAIYQFKNDQKINVSTKKIVIAYIEMFVFWWILLILAFLPPWPSAWAILFFPTLVIYTLQIFLWAHTWEDLDYKMRYYYLLHFLISVNCIVISLVLKTLFFPIE